MKVFRQRKVPRALGGSWKAKSKKFTGEGPPSSAASAKQLGLSSDEERQMALLLGRLIQHLRQTALRTPTLFIRRAGASVEVGRESGSEILESAAKQLCGSADSPADVLAVQDEHTWANVLKASLRELPHPLIPPHITGGLLARDFDVEPVLPAVKQAVEDLPHKDYEVLRDLCELLRDCASDSERLTHVFGVILLEPPGSHSALDSATMIRQAKAVTQIMRCLIVEAASVFGGAEVAAAEQPAPAEAQAARVDAPPAASSADLSSDAEEDLDESGDPDRPAGDRADGVRSREVAALFDYEAIEDDELNLNAGDLVRIISQIDAEWYLGQKICNNGTAETGMFPGAFCGLAGDEEFEPAEERDKIASAAFTAGDHVASALDTQDNVTTQETSGEAIGHVKALFDFVATSDDELALREDQVVELLSDEDQSWWYGRADDGSTGMFPRSFVERCELQPDAATLGFQTPKAVHAKPAPHSLAPPPPSPPVRAAASADLNPVVPPTGSGGLPPGGPPPKPPRTTGVSRTIDSPRAAPAFRMPPAVPPPSLVSEPPRPTDVQAAQPVSSEWRMTRDRYQLCCKFFNKLAVDVGGVSMVLGPAAAAFLEKSGLAKPVIARILELADIDGDCKLDRDEFVVAHHLTIAISKDGMPEPSSLPRYLIPKSKRKPTL